MDNLLKFINLKHHTIFFLIIFYGLSIAIFLKEINLLFLPNNDLIIIYLYRLIIIIFSIYLFLHLRKKINIGIIILIFINLIFLFNTIFVDGLNFKINGIEFFKNLNTHYDYRDIFFLSKAKILLINIFNVILPLIVLSSIDFKNFDLKYFKTASLKICNFFLIFLFFFLTYKLFYVHLFLTDDKNIERILINIHSLLYILNIHFLLIVDKIFFEKKVNKLDYARIACIFICLLITKSYIFILISFFTFSAYVFLFIKNKKFNILIILIALVSSIFLTFFQYLFYKLNLILYIKEPGTILNSIYIRIENINYYLFYSENVNLITGNNIFSDQAATYPHNFFIDTLICSGIIGVFALVYLFYLIFKNIKMLQSNKLFFLLLFFQSLIFSIFSGFLFTNIIFNISLAVLLCFVGEKDENIVKNSLG